MPITARKTKQPPKRPETSISQRTLSHKCPACDVAVASVNEGGLLLCHCLRCHHNWCSRLSSPPRACANCRTAYWTEPPLSKKYRGARPQPVKLPPEPADPADLVARPVTPLVGQTFLTREQADQLLPPPPGMQPEVKKVEIPQLTVAEHVPESELEGEWAEDDDDADESPDATEQEVALIEEIPEEVNDDGAGTE